MSWAMSTLKACQSVSSSKAAATGEGNPWLGGTTGEAAGAGARTSTFLAARYVCVPKPVPPGQMRLLEVGVSVPYPAHCWQVLACRGCAMIFGLWA
jgi:hypothetical protein